MLTLMSDRNDFESPCIFMLYLVTLPFHLLSSYLWYKNIPHYILSIFTSLKDGPSCRSQEPRLDIPHERGNSDMMQQPTFHQSRSYLRDTIRLIYHTNAPQNHHFTLNHIKGSLLSAISKLYHDICVIDRSGRFSAVDSTWFQRICQQTYSQ